MLVNWKLTKRSITFYHRIVWQHPTLIPEAGPLNFGIWLGLLRSHIHQIPQKVFTKKWKVWQGKQDRISC